MHKPLAVFIILMSFCSCDPDRVYDSYQSTPSFWGKDALVEFDVPVPDTLHDYNLFINIRNTGAYPFSNLFLITEMEFPNHSKVTDTLEYEMTEPDGSWKGSGFSDVKENKLWYKEQVRFPVLGACKVRIGHAMRKNGSAYGIDQLQGITDVGFRVEKRIKN
jgi:gliding motility-associated lipoprotein GldH